MTPLLRDRLWRLRLSTNCCLFANCRLLALLQLAFKHREVMHELLHAGAGCSRELLGLGVIYRCCTGRAELVSAPEQRASLAQERGDRFRGWRTRTVTVGHAAESASTATWGAISCAGKRAGDLQLESVVEALLAVTAEVLVERSFPFDLPIEVFILPLLVGGLAAV
jgi:hypothetical protein